MDSFKAQLDIVLGVASPDADAYRQRMHFLLDNLDKLSDPKLPTNEDEYRQLSAIRSAISSLTCFTFNSSHPADDRVWKLESIYAGLQARYNKRFELKRGPKRALARYLLWSKYFTSFDRSSAFYAARDRDLLRKSANGALYVVGLNVKTGDNVFTVDRLNRQHRQYCRTVGRQAICVRLPLAGDERERFLAAVPLLGEGYRETDVGDFKYSMRPVAMREGERRMVHALLTAYERERDQPPPPKVGASPAPMLPIQVPLFAGTPVSLHAP